MMNSKSGMTLVEVLLASMLLGLGMMTIFTGISQCLKLIQASKEVQEIQFVLDKGMSLYPVNEAIESEDDLKEIEVEDTEIHVDDDDSNSSSYWFSRVIDEKTYEDAYEYKDHLFTIKTSLKRNQNDDEPCEEIVQLLWLPKIDEFSK